MSKLALYSNSNVQVIYVSCKEPQNIEFNGTVSVQEGFVYRFGTEEKLPKFIQLDDESFMKLRTSPFVLRIHSSNKKKGHEENYAELLLFCAWRNEEVELHPSDPENCITKYNESLGEINSNRECIFPFSDNVKEMSDFMKDTEDSRPEHIYDNIDPAGNQEDDDDFEQLQPRDESELPREAQEGHYPEKLKFRPIDVLEEEEMLEMVRKLSSEQMIPFSVIVDYCKKETIFECSSEPPRIIVHGGGGVGKTAVINATSKLAEKILRKPGDNPMKPKVLLLAPTGMAASLIYGTTLQTGLNMKFGTKYLAMNDKKREELRVLFETDMMKTKF